MRHLIALLVLLCGLPALAGERTFVRYLPSRVAFYHDNDTDAPGSGNQRLMLMLRDSITVDRNTTFSGTTTFTGAQTFTGAATFSDSLTLSDGLVIDQTANNVFSLAENSEDITLTFASDLVTFASTTGALFTFTPAVTFSDDVTVSGDLNVTGSIVGDNERGSMGVTGGAELTIDVVDVDHVVTTYVTGSTTDVGVTFTANDTGAITAYADGTGKVDVTDTAHGLVTGDVINITDSTNYNGIWSVTKIDDDTFSIPDAWVADDGASNWKRGDRLVVDATGAGDYSVKWHATTSIASGTNKVMIAKLYVNEVARTADFCIMERNHSTTDIGSTGFSCLVTLAAADEVFVTIQNDTDAVNMTLKHSALTIERQ